MGVDSPQSEVRSPESANAGIATSSAPVGNPSVQPQTTNTRKSSDLGLRTSDSGQASKDSGLRTSDSGLSRLIRRATAHSLWPLMLGLDYSTLELYSAVGPTYDLARFGSEVMRPSPRQTDVLIVSGCVTRKMAPVIRVLHEAMAEPRFVIALGHGAVSGAPWQGSYNVLPGIEGLVPVDIWLPGDPPRPEAIIDAILALRARILAGQNAEPATMARYTPQRWPYLHEAMVLGDAEEKG